VPCLSLAAVQHTREFVDHSLQLLCGSALLARYRVCVRGVSALLCHSPLTSVSGGWLRCSDTALLGELSWRADPVPDYSGAQAATPVPAELHKLVRAHDGVYERLARIAKLTHAPGSSAGAW